MSTGLTGLLILTLLSGIVAFVSHKKITNYIFACVIASITTSVVFQVLNCVFLGHLDPFFLIAFATGAVLAFVIAVVVGIPFAYLRIKRERMRSDVDEEENGE
jgi:uncharacterized membrane protein YdjX (TVP38/TMEM64 family)